MNEQPVKAQRWLLGFYFANSCAEILQAVAMVWATYALTGNATLVGVVNAAAYLPGVVMGLYFQRHADKGRAARLLSMTNWVLFTGSLALTIIWVFVNTVSLLVMAIIVVQCSLSLIKLLNKAYIGRFVRGHFEAKVASRLLGTAASVSLVGGLAGGAAAGVLLDTTTAAWCFALAAGLYLLSLLAIRYAVVGPVIEANERSAKAEQLPPSDQNAADARTKLRLILLFSVPSSGALPFISTLMVPFAEKLSPGSGAFYSVLTVIAMTGGFIAGILLSSGRLSLGNTLKFALGGGGLIVASFAVVHSPIPVAVLMLLMSVVLTAHVISMQILTNQSPPAGEVGRFTVLRNTVAGSAKGVFSLAAGVIVDLCGLDIAWLALAILLAVFALLWSVVSRTRTITLATV